MNLIAEALERITSRKLVARLREAVKAHSDAWSDACEERDRMRDALLTIELAASSSTLAIDGVVPVEWLLKIVRRARP